MSDVDTCLDEVNGRLTAIWVKLPETKPFIWSFQKHVQYALDNPDKADYPRIFDKGRKWLLEMKWKHPMFADEFGRILDVMDKFMEKRG